MDSIKAGEVQESNGSIPAGEARAERSGVSEPRAPHPAAGGEVSAGKETGCLSITQPYSSQIGENGRGVASEDWLECSVGIRWPQWRLELLARLLEDAKAKSQSLRQDGTYVTLNGVTFKVGRQGKTKGGARGTHFEYVLEYLGVQVLLATRLEIADSQPNAWYTITGRDCLLRGCWEVRLAILELLTRLGGHVEFEKLSRVDIALDIAEVHVSEFFDPYSRGQVVSAARKDSVHRDDAKVTGFSRGLSPCRVVFYDKLKEARQSFDGGILEGLIQHRWGCLPSSATRIEFCLRRDFLKQYGINSPEEYLAKRASLVQQLTDDWFRLTTEPVDRQNKHQSRAETSPLWTDVQQALLSWAGRPHGKLAKVDCSNADVSKLMKQAMGCARKAALIRGESFWTLDDFLFFVMQQMALLLPDVLVPAWLDEFKKELLAYAPISLRSIPPAA